MKEMVVNRYRGFISIGDLWIWRMWLKTLVLPLVAAAAAVQAGSVQNGFEACRVSISRTSTDTTLLSHA